MTKPVKPPVPKPEKPPDQIPDDEPEPQQYKIVARVARLERLISYLMEQMK